MKKELQRTKQFKKNLKKRFANNLNAQQRINEAITLFVEGERDYPLNDHPLKGGMYGYRSFSAGGDIRIIYTETETAYIFTDIGSHNQVY